MNSREIDGFAPRDAGAGARVDSRDLPTGQEDAEDQVARLTRPAPGRGHGHAGLQHVEPLLADHGPIDQPPPLARRELGRETHAVALALEIGLDDIWPAA